MAIFTTQDGSELFYRAQGEGDPIVLIHGWPLCADMWENQELALLKAGFRVISYDRRGFGRSAHTGTGYDYNTFAGDLNDLIHHLRLDMVALAGFSMGGGEIARYLSLFGGKKVSRVALISSVVPFLLQGMDNPEGVPLSTFKDMKTKIFRDRHEFFSSFAKSFFGVSLVHSPVSTEVMAWTAQLANMASLQAQIDCVDAFAQTDFRGDLTAFNVPTLVVHGDADKIVPFAATGKKVAKLLPHAELVVYKGAPHGVFITHKDQLNHDMLGFFKVGSMHRGELESRSGEKNTCVA